MCASKAPSLSGIHHYSSTRVSFVDVGHAVFLHRHSKAIKARLKKSTKCICKLKAIRPSNEESVYR
jgi:hypothetical protein